MAKPRLIILIRHAQSEGNKNRDIHQTIPDHRVKLTSEGWQQAYEAGRRLKAMLRPDDKLHFFTSPYRRTRETTEGILSTLTENDSPFKRPNIKVYEEPRLREQDFGNFQPCSAEMERMWQERADYGHFFYRIPNGESAADAYDRISGFNESLWRQFGEVDFGSVCVLVTHGLMSRVFLMKWYHFTVEYFEDLRNVNHCEFLIMNKDDNGKYILQNKLRTWSELRRERVKEKEKETGKKPAPTGSLGVTRDAQKDGTKLPRNKSAVVIRRWGGCPNGCDHSRNFTRNRDSEMALLRQKDEQDAHKHSTELADAGRANAAKVKPNSSTIKTKTPRSSGLEVAVEKVTNGDNIAAVTSSSAAPAPALAQGQGQTLLKPSLLVRRSTRRMYNSDDDDPNDPEELSAGSDPTMDGGGISGPLIHGVEAIDIDTKRAQEEIASSPDATPSFISPEDRLRSMLSPELDDIDDEGSHNESSSEMIRPSTRSHIYSHHHHHHKHNLHVGRDGGGSYSGHASLANTDDESSTGPVCRSVRQPQSLNSLLARAAKKSARAVAAQKSGTAGGGSGNGEGGVPVRGKGVGSNNEDADDEEEESDFVNSEDIVKRSGMGRGARANRLGDDSGSGEEEDLDAAEKEDRSIRGSVY